MVTACLCIMTLRVTHAGEAKGLRMPGAEAKASRNTALTVGAGGRETK